jgi:hypothetical protein
MPTRLNTSSKTELPWPPAWTSGTANIPNDWSLDRDEVVRFDALLHEIHPDAPRVDADRLSQLAHWLLAMPEPEARDVLDERLARIEQLRAMLGDSDWDCGEADCARIRKLLDYMDQQENLIPDRIPLLGKLDDVLLLELAWPALAAEADEYEDFRSYRDSEHPDGDGSARRASWIRDRLAALALLQHQARVNEGRYVESDRNVQPFRIGG